MNANANEARHWRNLKLGLAIMAAGVGLTVAGVVLVVVVGVLL